MSRYFLHNSSSVNEMQARLMHVSREERSVGGVRAPHTLIIVPGTETKLTPALHDRANPYSQSHLYSICYHLKTTLFLMLSYSVNNGGNVREGVVGLWREIA